MDAWIAGAVFLVAYGLIAAERFDRTLVALLGGLLVIVLGVIDQHEAFAAIDFNVIFLLAGMMVLAAGLRRTGFFEWIAALAIHQSGGRPFRLLLVLALLTAILAAFLDNVTTVVLLTPVTLSIARTLRVSPIPYLVSQVFASNIGGTATLIGDPPNILIGSAAGLDFVDFLVNLTPVVVVILVTFLALAWVLWGRGMEDDEDRLDKLATVDPSTAITDRPLMIRALIVLGLTIVGFLVHSALGLEAATIALLGATILMIVGGVAERLADVVAGRKELATLGTLWFSALASAVVDNIPFTATAIPIIDRLAASGLHGEPLWWALALGACLGGYLTIVGASANIVVANLAARDGHAISFGLFLRYGAAVVAMSLGISTVYLWLRYLL
jgi:Na+/H+ antiporter NhaD/arsenite permease-like protein